MDGEYGISFTILNFPSTNHIISLLINFSSNLIFFLFFVYNCAVFHVTDQNGKKCLQEDVADRIQQVIVLQN